jgi:hypothetical protein
LKGLSKPWCQFSKVERIGQVGDFQLIHAGLEDVGQTAFVDEDRYLRFTHRQLGAVFDLVAVALEAMDHGVVAVVGPFDDIDELTNDFVP